MSQARMVILAGGQGSRFWPISRQRKPKQFLSISDTGENLLQATARRVSVLTGGADPIVVTNTLHAPLIEECLSKVKILSEPIARNTAASIGLAAIYLRKTSPKASMIVLPADHAVQNEARLLEVYQEGIELSQAKDVLVTIGVKPTFANTAYGYIQRGEALTKNSYKVRRFYEKPNVERAKKYLDSGEYYWNSGMFIWREDVILAAMQTYMPDLYQGLLKIEAAMGTSEEEKVIQAVFSSIENVSIDFGIMEHARNCVVLSAVDIGWNDVGSWDAWADHFPSDGEGNTVSGDALALESRNCVIQSNAGRMVACIGGQDLIIIDSPDAVLVCPRERVQDVKKIVDELKKRGRTELL